MEGKQARALEGVPYGVFSYSSSFRAGTFPADLMLTNLCRRSNQNGAPTEERKP